MEKLQSVANIFTVLVGLITISSFIFQDRKKPGNLSNSNNNNININTISNNGFMQGNQTIQIHNHPENNRFNNNKNQGSRYYLRIIIAIIIVLIFTVITYFNYMLEFNQQNIFNVLHSILKILISSLLATESLLIYLLALFSLIRIIDINFLKTLKNIPKVKESILMALIIISSGLRLYMYKTEIISSKYALKILFDNKSDDFIDTFLNILTFFNYIVSPLFLFGLVSMLIPTILTRKTFLKSDVKGALVFSVTIILLSLIVLFTFA